MAQPKKTNPRKLLERVFGTEVRVEPYKTKRKAALPDIGNKLPAERDGRSISALTWFKGASAMVEARGRTLAQVAAALEKAAAGDVMGQVASGLGGLGKKLLSHQNFDYETDRYGLPRFKSSPGRAVSMTQTHEWKPGFMGVPYRAQLAQPRQLTGIRRDPTSSMRYPIQMGGIHRPVNYAQAAFFAVPSTLEGIGNVGRAVREGLSGVRLRPQGR